MAHVQSCMVHLSQYLRQQTLYGHFNKTSSLKSYKMLLTSVWAFEYLTLIDISSDHHLLFKY